MGTIVAQTIVLETGDMRRLPTVGPSASYGRCVTSTTISHGKRKGQGNVNNGHPYLAWASREAAQLAIRFSPRGQRLYQRQQAKSHRMVARKAAAHQVARVCYAIMRALVPFDVHKAFG
jgi:transposase